jgi:hypothetical protein
MTGHAERLTGHDCHTAIFEDALAKLNGGLAIFQMPRNIGKKIKGTTGFGAVK